MEKDIDVSVKFAGVKMQNPIGVAPLALCSRSAADPEKYAEMLLNYVKLGAGYVYTPYTCNEREWPKDKPPTSRWLKSEWEKGIEGYFIFGAHSRIVFRLNPCVKLIRILKEQLPSDIPVFADIIGPGADPKGWVEIAQVLEEAGADLIEMDLSCPCPAQETTGSASAMKKWSTKKLGELGTGTLLGAIPDLSYPVIRAVAKAVKIPVGTKCSAEIGYPMIVVNHAQLSKEAGAKFVTGVAGPMSVAPPDIYNYGKPKWPALDSNALCGTGGPGFTIHTLYRNLAAWSMYVPDIDIAGVGGLVSPERHIEAMMLGAKITENASGLFWKGTSVIPRTLSFLRRYMDKYGYKSLEEFRGMAIKYFKAPDQIDWKLGEVIAITDFDKCNGCGICAHNVCFARYMKSGKAVVDEKECSGCGLCVMVCPTGACDIISLK